MRTIEVPDELLDLLKGSRLAGRSETDQVKTALAVHLFQEGLVSVGKAAALAGVPCVEFEWLLVEMGFPLSGTTWPATKPINKVSPRRSSARLREGRLIRHRPEQPAESSGS